MARFNQTLRKYFPTFMPSRPTSKRAGSSKVGLISIFIACLLAITVSMTIDGFTFFLGDSYSPYNMDEPASPVKPILWIVLNFIGLWVGIRSIRRSEDPDIAGLVGIVMNTFLLTFLLISFSYSLADHTNFFNYIGL